VTPTVTASARRRCLQASALVLAALGLAGPIVKAQTSDAAAQRYPDVVAVQVRASGSGRFDFDVTVSSSYDTPSRYADAFRVTSTRGAVYGERRLLHDHAGEQPFTRDLHGVTIPAGTRTVVVQARDSRFGYGGKVVQVALPGRH